MLQPEHSFVSVILNFVSPVAEEITQSLDHFEIRLTSQLISGISRVLQKLLNILMAQLFQQLLYYLPQKFFQLFLF